MGEQLNQSTARQGKALAESIMNAISGCVGVRLNGEIVQSNSRRSKLYVGNNSIPIDKLHANLTEHELKELEGLPFWDGNNAYQICAKVLCHVSAAIRRFQGVDYDSPLGYDSGRILAQEKELAMCLCDECFRARTEREL